MSAEEIAKVVADLRGGRYVTPRNLRRDVDEPLRETARVVASNDEGPVVDATAIYRSLVDHWRPVNVYEDHPNIAPPWEHAVVGYRNEHGNVLVANVLAREQKLGDDRPLWDPQELIRPGGASEPDETMDHTVDWSRVRWVTYVVLWIGGRGASGPAPTAGPTPSSLPRRYGRYRESQCAEQERPRQPPRWSRSSRLVQNHRSPEPHVPSVRTESGRNRAVRK